MSKRQKRLSKICQNPKNVSKDELDQVLADYGFINRQGKGFHTIYQHPEEETPIVVAIHGKHVPAYIVKQVLSAIDRIGQQEDSDDNDESEND